MILYLGKSDARELRLPLVNLEAVTLWLREDDDLPSTLISEEGPANHIATREGWRIFVLQGFGVWRATYVATDGFVQASQITIGKEDEGYYLEVA
jgi:hypothetical protein